MFASLSSTTRRHPVFDSIDGAVLCFSGMEGLRRRDLDGLNKFGELGKVGFQPADGVSLGERSQRGGISREKRAMRPLAQRAKIASKGASRIDGQTVVQRRPLGAQ